MLVGAVVVPGSPLLVPGFAASDPLHDLRRAVAQTIDEVVAVCRPEAVVVIGAGTDHRTYPAGSTGSLGGLGLDVEVTLGGEARPGVPSRERQRGPLPLSLTIGAWVLARCAPALEPLSGAMAGIEVPEHEEPAACAAVGARLASEGRERTLALAVADGSAAITPSSPGMVRSGAAELDARIGQALASGEWDGIADVSPRQAGEAMIAGRAPLQVLAAAWDQPSSQPAMPLSFVEEAGLDVTYWVAGLVRADSPSTAPR
jgi:hypothetical protein